MSQERSEQPTSKRLRDAAERGQVARSKEVQDVVQLAAALMTLSWVGSYMVRTLADKVGAGLSRIDDVAHRNVMPSELTAIAAGYLGSLAFIVGPVMLTAVVAALAAVSAQGGWNVSWQPLQPKFSKLSPANGLKRLVPTKAGLDLVRVAIVATALAWVAWGVLEPFVETSPLLSRVSLADAAGSAWLTVVTLVKRALIVFATIATADYLLKRYQMRKSLKMTKQEVKDEHKMLEGNPEIKGRVRRLQREMARAPHAGRGAQGHRRHHQPDPLRGRARVQARRHGRAAGAGQGRRPHRAAHQGRRPRARRSRRSRTSRWPARSTATPRSTK